MLSPLALLRMFYVARPAQAREKHPRTPNLRSDSYVDGRTFRSEARRTINQAETNQSILAELVAHLRAENAAQQHSFTARLDAKDSQVSYILSTFPRFESCADTVFVMAYRSHDWKLMSVFDEMSCSVSAQASTFCSLWVQARPCPQIKLL